jgi:hypothetical protein
MVFKLLCKKDVIRLNINKNTKARLFPTGLNFIFDISIAKPINNSKLIIYLLYSTNGKLSSKI